jgi:hypothetical protein
VEIARLYGKNESSIREVVKIKENIRASFSVATQTAKVAAIARDKGGKNFKFLGGKYEEKEGTPLYYTLLLLYF